MNSVRASAPGKIVLCGEYVVLGGTAALGLALDRRASVTITANENRATKHVVECPGFADRPFTFQVADDFRLEWQGDSQPGFDLLQCVWKSMEFRPSGGLHLCLDTKPLVDVKNGGKLGIGSSAALAVALSAAIASMQDREVGTDEIIEIHRRFQQGRGSGIDVATAKSGGLIEYRIGNCVETRRQVWPDDLQYAILWSGASVSTGSRLAAFEAAGTTSTSRGRLAAASERIIGYWPQLDAPEIVSLFIDYVTLLQAFSVEHGLGIFDAGHGELVREAASYGIAYKPCGAGGGDVGIALSTHDVAMNDFFTEATDKGFQVIDCCIDELGLLIDDRSS